ncbi:centrosomal protein of 70 kDa [Diretmus argenteus]
MDGERSARSFFHSRDKTFVYLWTYRQFQQEQIEWDGVNKLLQHHGFRTVYFADPIENKNLSDLVLLDKKSAGEIRTTLRTMLTDSERRQALIQELIQSNHQLKAEAQEQMSRASRQARRTAELEELLDGVKAKVQDLEDRYLADTVQQRSHAQRLQQEKQDTQKRCEDLEQTLSNQKEASAQLQRKLHFTVSEEERRLARQRLVFQRICKTPDQQRPDQQVLDVIDFYETQIIQLRDELRGGSEGAGRSDQTPADVTPSFKTILKSFQEQLEENKAQNKALSREVESLKRELEMRPTVKEVKSYKYQLRRLEGLMKQNNKSTKEEDDKTRLRNSEAGNISGRVAEAGLCSQYHHLLSEIGAVLTNPKAAMLQLHRPKPTAATAAGLLPAEFEGLVPTLQVWAQQLHSLKELHRGLNTLSARLMPWQPPDAGHDDPAKVEDMMLLVDTMLENTATDSEKVLRSPTRFTLESMVSHFQKLFDVGSLSGVFPRMSDVYTRLGELTNAMRNLRDVLDLDDGASPSQVVNQVARLVSNTDDTVGLQLRRLLGDGDIDSIIVKVKQHEEFFPAFHSLVLEMFQILGVSRLDDVVPALRSLTQQEP